MISAPGSTSRYGALVALCLQILSLSTLIAADMDRASYDSPGFIIDNYMVDGIPAAFTSRWNPGDAQTDMALCEQAEVVCGATGLLTGPGNPSAAINMVVKHANSNIATGSPEASYGSRNNSVILPVSLLL